MEFSKFMLKILFFGSFQHYSALILDALVQDKNLNVIGVVTTPPKPAGRKQELKKTEVQLYAEQHQLPIFTPESLKSTSPSSIINTPFELIVTAGYGKILPKSWMQAPKFGALNLHFSLLPKYRGANPAEWAILMGETETGITLIEMSEKLDAGGILAQAKIPIYNSDTRETLYQKLYELGAQKLPFWLINYLNYKNHSIIQSFSHELTLPPVAQPLASPTPYAKRLKREDGFIDWKKINDALNSNQKTSEIITRSVRALSDFPGVWTLVPTKSGEKRMKILSCEMNRDDKLELKRVQFEGQNEATWNQVKNQLSNGS